MKKFLIICVAALSLAACQQTIPKEALELSSESLQWRQQQTRRFDTANERNLLIASSQLLQDLGYTIEESEVGLGVVLGVKDRDAVEAGQVAAKIIMAGLFGANMPIDAKQKIRASVVTRRVGSKSTNVRVTFQRIVWSDMGQISRLERIEDEAIYQDFFSKLSKSVFLTANQI